MTIEKNNADHLDNLGNKLTQLSALIEVANGQGVENFDLIDRRIRSRYLWVCSDLINDAEESLAQLSSNLKAQGGQAA